MAIAIVEMDPNEEQQHAASNMSMPPSQRHTPPNNQPKQQQSSSSRSSSESEQSSASKLFADPAGPSPARQVTVTAEQQQASSRQQQNNSLTANELWRMHQEQQRREENHALLQLLRQQQRQNDMLSGGGGNPMTSGTSSSSTGMRNNFAATTQQRQQSLMDNINNNNFDMNPISIRRMGMDNSNARLTMPEGSYLMNNCNRSDMMNNHSNSSNLGSGMGINNSMDRSSSLMNNRGTMDMSTSLRYMELLNNIMPTPMSSIRSSSVGMGGDTTRTSSNFDTQLMNDNFMSSSFGNGSGRMGSMSSSNNYGSSSAADYTSFNSELLLQQQLLNNESAYMRASSSSGMGGVGMSTSNNLGPPSMASSSLLHQQQNNNDPLYGKVTAPPKMYPQEDQGWEQQFKALQHYQMQFGHCRVPARFKANPKLGRWVMTQRRQFTLLMQGFPSALTAERIRRLETLGFTWSVRPEPVTTWNSKFQELKGKFPTLCTSYEHFPFSFKHILIIKSNTLYFNLLKLYSIQGHLWKCHGSPTLSSQSPIRNLGTYPTTPIQVINGGEEVKHDEGEGQGIRKSRLLLDCH